LFGDGQIRRQPHDGAADGDAAYVDWTPDAPVAPDNDEDFRRESAENAARTDSRMLSRTDEALLPFNSPMVIIVGATTSWP